MGTAVCIAESLVSCMCAAFGITALCPSRATAAADPTGRSLVQARGSTASVKQAGQQIHESHYPVGRAFLIASISLSCRRLCSWTRLTRLCPLCLMVMTRLVWLSRDTSMSWAPCALKNSSLWSLSNIKSDLRSHQDVGWVVLNQVCRHDLSPDEARAVHD
uniref:Uncharacterized protein n=1 Tax=Setaria viridis TaxID=4556 RepID=A0A4U6VFH6_SETVI|nr:hypothetical protein SEVIR_3G329500v2 [Setaria viridis]